MPLAFIDRTLLAAAVAAQRGAAAEGLKPHREGGLAERRLG